MKQKWETEPNELNFEAHGLLCHIFRHPKLGHLCGYVGVDKTHPLYGKDYDDMITVPDFIRDRVIDIDKVGIFNLIASTYDESKPNDIKVSLAFDVHGGLTFSKFGKDSDLWWFGFDCAHSGDLIPYQLSWISPSDMGRFSEIIEAVYRDIEYVKSECDSLALQLSLFVERK